MVVKAWAGRALVGVVLAGMMAGTAAGALAAPKQTARSKQKAQAEASRASIQEKLERLKREVNQVEDQKEEAADALAESEDAISEASRKLRELADEQSVTNRKLADLATEQERLAKTIATQKQQLTRLLREQYLSGNEDRIKLLLSGDNPHRISRELQIMGYVSQAQAKLLGALRANLANVQANQEAVQNARDELEEIAAEEREQKAVLEKEKTKRAALLNTLSSRLSARRKEIGNLERNEKNLNNLVDRLDRLVKEEEAAAERRRQAAAAAAKAKAEAQAKARAEALARAQAEAKARAERERQVREQLIREQQARAAAGKNGNGATRPEPARPAPEARPPEPRVVQREAEPVRPLPPAEPKADAPASAASAQPAGAAASAHANGAAADEADKRDTTFSPKVDFASLRGKLRTPVSGTIVTRFGAKRAEGGSTWKGLLIGAAEGADVRAVADGKVIFAGRLRGYGNLILLNHGNAYMSVYGFNESLLKREGDLVRAGDPIATVGNTGGSEQSGLYFELRRQGQAFDPAGWVQF